MTSPKWNNLTSHASLLGNINIRQLFAEDPDRFNCFSLNCGPLLFDFSKNKITQETITLLCQLAEESALEEWREKMFAGADINNTEKRSVLHTALRDPNNKSVRNDVDIELAKMDQLCNALHQGSWTGYSGKPLKQVVAIGIGGSYLGPKLACEALQGFTKNNIKVHFVANVDAHVISNVLSEVSAEETLFVVISKTFTTQETLANADTAVKWLLEKSQTKQAIQKQFIAITSNASAAVQFGITNDHILNMWDWVGGRYSLWSTVGFPLALQIGMKNFRALLAGAHAIDQHFQEAPLHENAPVILGLLGIWNNNFLDCPHCAVLPYDHRLRSLPGYLQQLDMESNGKCVTREGNAVDYMTGPILFGEAGTNGQHAFHQLLHQGTSCVPCDFIGFAQAEHTHDQHHEILLANMLAQSQAMMMGRTTEETLTMLIEQNIEYQQAQTLAAHMTFPGNRPSNTIMSNTLDPYALGALIALYEHKIFVQGIIWNINSFDQMGVELGKTLTKRILPAIQEGQPYDGADSSTSALLNFINEHRHSA